MTLVADAPAVTPPVAQLEEMKNIKNVRKKRAPRHDFHDGQGRVLAHRHDNGKGWVADTAHVADSVYVGPRAEVFQYARVLGNTRLKSHARVHGHATVEGNVVAEKNVCVFGRASVRDNTELHDTVSVSGNAVVAGTSRIFGSYRILEHAHVLGSCLRGSGRICGEATVLRSSLSGDINIENSVSVVNATINGRVSLRNFCQVLNSTINFSSTSTERFTVSDFAVIADHSNICMPLTVENHAIIVRTALQSYDWHGNPLLTFASNIIATNRRFTNYNDIAAFIAQFATQGANMYAPPPPVGVVRRAPVPVQPSARRVMRLELAET